MGFDTSSGNRTYTASLTDSNQGALGVTKVGPNTLILTGNSTYSGNTTINGGTLTVSGPGTLGFSNNYSGNIVFNNGSVFNYAGAAPQTLSGVISGNGTVIQSGAGELSLSGTVANTYSGGTVLSNGNLYVGGNSALGSGPLSISGGSLDCASVTINNPVNLNNSFVYGANFNNGMTWNGPVTLGANVVINVQASSGLYIGGNIGDGGHGYGITLTGGNYLELDGTNTYTGKTIVAANSTLGFDIPLTNVGVAGPLGAPTGANAVVDIYGGGTITYTGPQSIPFSTNRPINIAGNSSGTATIAMNDNDTIFAFNGPITASPGGAKTLNVVLGCYGNGDREEVDLGGVISNASDGSPTALNVTFNSQTQSYSFLNLTAVNTFTGPITLVQGQNQPACYLTIGGRGIGANGNQYVSTAGTGCLGNGNYSGDMSLGTQTVVSYNSSASQIFSGVITGFGGISQYGPGPLTLANSGNNYIGATNIYGGLLQATVAGALSPNSSITLSNGTLDVSSAAQTTGALTINGGYLNVNSSYPLTVYGTAALNGGVLNLSGSYSVGQQVMNYFSETGPGFAAVTGLAYGLGVVSNGTELDVDNLPYVWLLPVTGGSWSTSSNWSSPPDYGNPGIVVTIGEPITDRQSHTIIVDEPTTLGSLVLGSGTNGSVGYILSDPTGMNTMNFNNSGNGASITVQNGVHALNLPIALNDNLTVTTLVSSAQLTISGAISGLNNTALTVNGSGMLTISGSNNTWSGTTVNGGTLSLNGETRTHTATPTSEPPCFRLQAGASPRTAICSLARRRARMPRLS